MSRKSLKILLVLVTILSLVSTFSFATDETATDNTNSAATTTSEENSASTSEETTDGTTDEEGTDGETAGETTGDTETEEPSTNHDLYVTGTDITVEADETVNGNAFLFGDTVTIRGQIGGDLFVVANTLNVDGGQIYGNVFALASDTIRLDGLIYDLYAVCDNLTVAYDGLTYRDLKVTCNTASINGVIGKDVNIEARESLTIESDCFIYGNLNYSAPTEIDIADSLIEGDTNYSELSITSSNNVLGYVISLLTILVFTLIVWLVASKLAPKFYGRLTTMAPKKMALSILVGLLALIITPLVAALLMMTIVGIPVGLALLAIYMIAVVLSFAMAVMSIAAKLASKVKALAKLNNLLAVILVTIVLWLLSLIPYAGLVITFVVILAGFGMLILSVINKKEKTEKVAE